MFLFITAEKGREIFNTWRSERKVRWEQSTSWWGWHHNQIADGEIWSILPSKKEFGDRKKKIHQQISTIRRNNRWLHHRLEEPIIDLWVLRHQRWTDTVQAGWWNRIDSSETCAATEGIKSKLRKRYWDMQCRWNYKKSTATDAWREKNWKDK